MENNCAVRNNTKAEKPKIRPASFAFIGSDVCAFILSQSYILPLLFLQNTILSGKHWSLKLANLSGSRVYWPWWSDILITFTFRL